MTEESIRHHVDSFEQSLRLGSNEGKYTMHVDSNYCAFMCPITHRQWRYIPGNENIARVKQIAYTCKVLARAARFFPTTP